MTALNSSVTPSERPRLSRLLDRVRDVLADGADHTLHELAERCHGGEASVSARIRELNQDSFLVRNRPASPGAGLRLYWHPRGATQLELGGGH